jgi:hypothetical protein
VIPDAGTGSCGSPAHKFIRFASWEKGSQRSAAADGKAAAVLSALDAKETS